MEDFIEINLITKDKHNKTVVKPEAILISDISSFRPWQKGEKDSDVDGEMTLLILKNNGSEDAEKPENERPKEQSAGPSAHSERQDDKKIRNKKIRQVHINEAYTAFIARMRTRVIIR